MTSEREALARIVTPLTNLGLDDFRMGRASNDELTRRMVDALLNAGFRPAASELWSHAECCFTGTGCTHDDPADCADSLLQHAHRLMRTDGA